MKRWNLVLNKVSRASQPDYIQTRFHQKNKKLIY